MTLDDDYITELAADVRRETQSNDPLDVQETVRDVVHRSHLRATCPEVLESLAELMRRYPDEFAWDGDGSDYLNGVTQHHQHYQASVNEMYVEALIYVVKQELDVKFD